MFSKALEAVNPYELMKEILRIEKNHLFVTNERGREIHFHLDRYKRIFLAGAGKASASMAQAAEEIFGDRLATGIITTKYGHTLSLRQTESIEAGHPIPDQNGIDGTRKVQSLMKACGKDDLVIFLLSGGGSSLLPLPADGISLEEKQKVTQLLLDSGADIKEINTIRKHISQAKGGWLARWAYPSTVLTFILSDVVGDPLEVIGSGPTVPDSTTFEDALEVLKKYDLLEKISLSIRDYLCSGKEGKAEETPKPGDSAFDRVTNIVIGSNLFALKAAQTEALRYGFNTLILSSSIVGETREAAQFHASIARELVSSGNPVRKPACIISGGETTVTIRGAGLGGRNQEFALAGAIEIEGLEKVILLSGATDGTDGPTDAAGAIADHTTTKRAMLKGLDPKKHLKDNNAYPFFKSLGDLLITGPTYTNVMDVRILLVV